MKSTREQILDTLAARHIATTEELARLTQLTPANIRHHLRNLVRDTLVVKTGRRIVDGRGRPAEVYALAAQPDNVEQLASLLMDRHGRDEMGLARLAAAFVPDRADRGSHITQRLVAAMAALNRLNYRPRWEPDPQGPQVIFGHCPFMAIIAEHPELCRMDGLILERLTGESAEQVEKLAVNNEGALYCRFAVAMTVSP